MILSASGEPPLRSIFRKFVPENAGGLDSVKTPMDEVPQANTVPPVSFVIAPLTVPGPFRNPPESTLTLASPVSE